MSRLARHRVLLSWSGGKDSAWTARLLLQADTVDIVGALTTVDAADGSVPHHGVTAEALALQVAALPFPHRCLPLPVPTPDSTYVREVGRTLADWGGRLGAQHVAFGDLFLEDVRAFRESLLAGTGLDALFPLWGMDTGRLAREMLAGGLEATISAVDPRFLSADRVGEAFDATFLRHLPDGVDPCGERGEFHTVVAAGRPLGRIDAG